MNASLTERMGAPITWESLPDVDRTRIQILKQSYTLLGETERKAGLHKDSITYLTKIVYLFFSNFPTPILTTADMQTFMADFQEHIISLSTVNPDIEYFSDLGNRLELFLDQANNIEVPETMIDLHVKFIRLMKGYLSMRETASPAQDPLAGMIILKKVSNLNDLAADFFRNDVSNYFTQFQDTQQ